MMKCQHEGHRRMFLGSKGGSQHRLYCVFTEDPKQPWKIWTGQKTREGYLKLAKFGGKTGWVGDKHNQNIEQLYLEYIENVLSLWKGPEEQGRKLDFTL